MRFPRISIRRVSAVVVVLLLGAAIVIKSSPARSTRTYSVICRNWISHWPPELRAFAFLLAEPLFRPLVPIRRQVEPGVNMLLDPQDLVSRRILEYGNWEPSSWAGIAKHLPAGGTFVDVGAHIGYYTLKANHAVGPQGRVIAVEPNPETLRLLHDNIRESGAKTISVQPFACGDSEGELDLYGGAHANTGVSSLSKANAAQFGAISRVHRVRVRPLDDIIDEMHPERVDVIKIDVEGADLLVIKGAVRTLSHYKPVLIVEVEDSQLRAMGASADELRAFLQSQGYTARRAFGQNVVFSRREE
jgi:FkbM family methyltransferase